MRVTTLAGPHSAGGREAARPASPVRARRASPERELEPLWSGSEEVPAVLVSLPDLQYDPCLAEVGVGTSAVGAQKGEAALHRARRYLVDRLAARRPLRQLGPRLPGSAAASYASVREMAENGCIAGPPPVPHMVGARHDGAGHSGHAV